jgi:phosphate transport system protein
VDDERAARAPDVVNAPTGGTEGATGTEGVTGIEGVTGPSASVHLRDHLEREMRGVRDDVLRMGSMVVQAIHEAVEALVDGDRERATAVIVNDVRINDMQAAILVQVVSTIATQAPVARDLRYLLALDRVTYELERMGDHAASVAKQAQRLADDVPPAATRLRNIGLAAAELVSDVLRALIDVDEEAARAVAARDDEVDHRYKRAFDETMTWLRAEPDRLADGISLLFAAHDLERIGDRATNIAEDVVFLTSGRIEDLNP